MNDARYSVTGSGLDLSRKQQDLIALAESLGPAFAKRAPKYDSEASFPFENYAELRRAGLLGLCVPEEFGGMGADLRTYALVSATLGKYCGATALTFNMHACSTLWPGILADALNMTPAQRIEHDPSAAYLIQDDTRQGQLFGREQFVFAPALLSFGDLHCYLL